MGISKKSQNRKQSDKETQSPMLKIIKDIMQREKNDPERANLIKKERQESRKKKTYSGMNQKCDTRSCDSSSTERYKPSRDSKMAQDLQQQIYNDQQLEMTQSIPFTGDKKESWWCWKDTEKKKKATSDDTCSCVSCALKKVIGSDYVCIACLVLVFCASVAVGFFVVYKGVVPVYMTPHARDDAEAAKQSELMKARRQFRSEGTGGDTPGYERRKKWSDVVTNPWRSLPLLSGAEIGDSNLRDTNYVEESGSGISGALSRILDTQKLTDGQTSEKLRDFYKRLIQTDARIKKLKKQMDMSSITYNTVDDLNVNSNVPDRYKRSLMSVNNPSFYDSQRKEIDYDMKVDLSKFNIFYPPFVGVRNEAIKPRIKRADEDIFNKQPAGIIIEKKKVMVQYAPVERKRNFPKCSHSPKESKSHEKQLKHPFYKNSQRLDELLDQLLENKIDKVISSPLNLGFLIGDREKCKHSKQEQEETPRLDYDLQKQDALNPTEASEDGNKFTSAENTDVNLDSAPEDIFKLSEIKRQNPNSDAKSSLIDKEELHKDENDERNRHSLRSTTSPYDVLLSVSTLMNSGSANINKMSKTKPEEHFKKRKLLQLNEENDETLGYEDFKEVLADDTDSHDETDKQVERDKRSENSDRKNARESNKYNNPPVYNPNWKGSMQLYPDELNLITKPAAAQNSKVELPASIKAMAPQDVNVKVTDTEYVEDYLNNKYAKLAQAYSDYGVLAEKKEYVTNGKSTAVTESNMPQHKFNKDEALPEKEQNMKSYVLKKRRNANLLSPAQEKYNTKFEVQSSNTTHFLDAFNISGLNSNDNSDPNSSKFMPLSNDKSGEKQIQFPKYRIERSLKSVNIEELKEDLVIKDEKEIVPFLMKEIKQEKINETSVGGNKTLEGFSDILSTLSDWFLTLAKLSGDFGNNTKSPQNNHTLGPTLLTSENITKDIAYPMYDADMIDNIGHRSRALLAIDEIISNTSSLSKNVTDLKKEEIMTAEMNTDPSQTLTNNTSKTIATVKQPKVNVTEVSNKTYTVPTTKDNRTVIKRAADSNLIFWNDIYDDEYGVKVDHFDNEQRNKHSADNESFVKRSGQWINKKFRKLEDRIRTEYRSKKNWRQTSKSRPLRSVDEFRPGYHLQKDQSDLFGAKMAAEDKETDKAFDFATLTANMKQICHEASKALQKTRKINVRQDKSEIEATSLMQQLVRLMTDLVDFQVQQKTCSMLPPDLAEFLQWLTSPNSDDTNDNKFTATNNDANAHNDQFPKTESPSDGIPDYITPFSRQGREVPKTEYVNTLRAVRELLRQYEDFDDEFKKTLAGVKEYLQEQVEFLTKQLRFYNDYNIPSTVAKFLRKRDALLRRKRHMRQDRGKAQVVRKQPLTKRINKFIKKSGVKRTRTTSNYYDSIATEGLRKRKHRGDRLDPSGKPKTTVQTGAAINASCKVS